MARELASDIEDIARTIAELALPGMRPKDLVDGLVTVWFRLLK